MAVVRRRAYLDGFATAGVQVDGRNCSLGNPARLLNQILASIRGDGLPQATPVAELYRRAMDRRASAPIVTSVGIDRTANNFLVAEAVE